MRLSLGVRVFLLVAAINLATFGIAGVVLVSRLAEEGERLALSLTEDLVRTLRGTISPDRELNVAPILRWPGWSEIDDAVLLDRNFERGSDGRVRPIGVAINPVGRAGRDPLLQEQPVLDALALAIESEQPIDVAGGRATPVRARGELWGACWFRLQPRDGVRELVRTLGPWFALSTALLVVGTFLALRGLVLVPVSRLSAASRRVAGGDLGARVPQSGGTDELRDLVRTFNSMAETVESLNRDLERRVADATDQARRAEKAAMIQRRLAAMGELAAGIAHEINNPLGGMQSAVEALRKPDLRPERRERYLELLRDGLERVGRTVGQVLRMAPRETAPRPVDLLAAVADAVGLVRHRAESEGVELAVVVDGVPEPLEGGRPDPARAGRHLVLGESHELSQALLNLLVNALDALEDGVGDALPPGTPARVEIALDRVGAEERLVVRDTGPGLDAERLERAADLFFSTKDVGRGTGLGLSIVHNVVDAHGGRVALESAPGRGFTADLRLPVAPEREVPA